MRAAGVNVRAGEVYLAVVDPTDTEQLLAQVVESPTRLRPNNGLGAAERAVDLRNRIREDLRSLDVQAVGLVGVRLYSNWGYQAAYDRVTAITSVMFCCVELQITYTEIKTEEIARLVGAPAAELKTTHHELFGHAARPTYWTTGLAEAYGAAAVMVRNVEKAS